jgi:hypothetical protein
MFLEQRQEISDQYSKMNAGHFITNIACSGEHK